MSDRSVVSGLRGMAAAGALLAVTGTGVFVALGHIGLWWSNFAAFVAVLATFCAVLVWLASPRQPRNAVVWTMAASALLGGAHVFLAALSVLVVADQPDLIPVVVHTPVVPSDLPTPVAWMRLVAEPAATTAVFLPLTFGLLLFPDGTLPSPGGDGSSGSLRSSLRCGHSGWRGAFVRRTRSPLTRG